MSQHAFHIAAELPRSTSQPTSELATSYRVPLTCGIGLTVVTTFWLHAFYILPNHDNSWFLLGTQRIIAGGQIYHDVFDPNLPLIYVLLAPSVLLAKLTGLNTYLTFTGYICLLILWSVLKASRPLLLVFESRRVPGTIAVLTYAVLLCLLPGYQFGQREHLSIILACPWLFRFALRDNGESISPGSSSVTTTVFAAVGFLIKPYFLLLPIGLLIVCAIERRSWHVFVGRDATIFGTVSALSAIAIIFVFPQWFAVAQLAADTYRFLDQPMAIVIASFRGPVEILLGASVIWELARIDEPLHTFFRYLALASVLFFISAIVQHKGWDYQDLPALMLALIVMALLVLAIGPTLTRKRLPSRVAAVILIMALVLQGFVVTFPWFLSNFRSRSVFLAQPFPHNLSELARGQSFIAIAAWGLDGAFPTVSLINARWSSRTAAQWLLPGIVGLSQGSLAERERAVEIRQLWTRQMAEDLGRYLPVVVAVRTANDHNSFDIKGGFDILQILSQDEGFRRSWAPYHRARVIKDWVFYTRAP